MSRLDIKDIRIEYPSAGATYNRDGYGVYEYSEYPRSSVLAGQERRVFLNFFDTLEEAKAAYPNARQYGCGYAPPSLEHLPADEDEGIAFPEPEQDWQTPILDAIRYQYTLATRLGSSPVIRAEIARLTIALNGSGI